MKNTVLFVNLIPHFRDLHSINILTAQIKKYTPYKVDYVFGYSMTSILKKVLAIDPCLILYSSNSTNLYKYILFDGQVKKQKHISSIIGGPGATFAIEPLFSSTIDFICVGEGEIALVDFLNSTFTPKANIFKRERRASDTLLLPSKLDDLPFPDRELVYSKDSLLRSMGTKQFIRGRGCPYSCAYCWNQKSNDLYRGIGPICRQKSVDYLISEILEVKKKYPIKTIIFDDDTFTSNKSWFLDFSEKYARKVGIHYGCNLRADQVDDDIVRALKESKCIDACWSIESGSDAIRNDLLHRKMSKEQILAAAELFKRHKLPTRVANIIGLPGETISDMYETVKLNILAKVTTNFANTYVPFPNLELTKYAIFKGYLDEESLNNPVQDFWRQSVLNYSNQEKVFISNLMSFFPFFIKHPFLWKKRLLREMLLKFPAAITRFFYIFVYSILSSRTTYRALRIDHKLRFIGRHLKSVFCK